MKAREHPLYGAWAAMVNRATTKGKKKCYEHVTIFEPWNDRARPVSPGPCIGLLRFANYVEENLGPQNGLSLDRIDSSKGYEPGNIQWATLSQQNINRRIGWIKPTMTPIGRLLWAHPHKYGWLARFRLGGLNHSIGVYNTQEEAHEAARIKREEILNSITYKLS